MVDARNRQSRDRFNHYGCAATSGRERYGNLPNLDQSRDQVDDLIRAVFDLVFLKIRVRYPD